MYIYLNLNKGPRSVSARWWAGLYVFKKENFGTRCKAIGASKYKKKRTARFYYTKRRHWPFLLAPIRF